MNPLAKNWQLDPAYDYLNHGSFGACPREVLEYQQSLRDELEAQPMKFFTAGLEERLDEVRDKLAVFVGAAPADLAFVPNATTGVNAVLRSLSFEPGDELLTTDHAYNACRNALQWVARRHGARIVVAEVPFPLRSSDEVVDAIAAAITDRTRLALIDHITSSTALVLPIEKIIDVLHERDVEVLVDGAHAPGMVDLDIAALGAAFYTGNCHKWMCAPKGAAFLHVRSDRQSLISPHVISHGENADRPERSRLHLGFDWVGTTDPTAQLSVGKSIDVMANMVPGGWPEVRQRNRELCLAARDLLCQRLGLDTPAPAEMIGSIASLTIGEGGEPTWSGELPLTASLRDDHGIEVRCFHFPWPRRVVRISAQLYNDLEQYERLANALVATR